MVQPKYSPQEALNKIKLMMGYDSLKTLNENKSVIFEQSSIGPSETSTIARKIYKSFMGDVQSSDLQDVMDILNDEVIGKTYEDGTCLLNKVDSYIKNIKGGEFSDYFTTLQGLTAHQDMKNKYLGDLITMSKEEGEPEFTDIKNKLVVLINNERRGFCKTPVTSTPNTPNTPNTPTPAPVRNRYRNNCTGTYTKGCKSEAIKPVQTCLGLVPDGKFWVKTQAALESKGFPNGFTDADVSKICGSQTPQPSKPNIEDKYEPDAEEASDVLKQ